MVRRTSRRPNNQMAFRLPLADFLPGEIIVDSFAGGGGASIGIEKALGRSPDIAINHDPAAIAMHEQNHPATKHFQESVWKVNPRQVTEGRPVGLLWASPDCRHFSRAKGGKPVSPRVRGLAWVVVSWARQVRPRVICLENVPEFLTWGPLGPDSKPIKAKEGETFQAWRGQLERLGYVVEHRILNAADFGAPTSRKRVFMVARCDGAPIRWPAPSHGKTGRPLPWRTAAECIDREIPCPSIFHRKRKLAEATLRRTARGTIVHAIEAAEPFFMAIAHGESGSRREYPISEPLKTQTRSNQFAIVSPVLAGCGGRAGQSEPRPASSPMYTMTKKADTCLIAPTLVGIDHRGSGDGAAWPVILPLTTVTKDARHALAAVTLIQTGYGERPGQAPRVPGLNKPLGTLVDGQKHAVVACAIKHYGGVVGQGLEKPLGTITKVDHHSLCTGNVVKLYGTSTSAGLDEPLPTVTKGGQHLAMAVGHLQHYYSEGGQDQALGTPMHTIPTKARHALVLGELGFNLAGAFRVARFLMKYGNWIPKTYVHLGGRYRPVVMIRKGSDWYLMTDIGLRMLQPHELAKAQGFPDDYILTGTKSEQVAKIGNSVCPPVAEALVRANLVAEAAQPYEAIA